ncbi:MAG: DUF4214 domain-containing protein [Pseudomonadota bacterium]
MDSTTTPAPAKLDDAVLLNRAVYGGEFYLENEFRGDYDPAIDPPAEGDTNLRFALNVYDRYDTYLEPFGFTVLDGEDLGFTSEESAAGETSADDLNVFYRGGLYRNSWQELEDGTLQNVPDGAAVALVTVNETGDETAPGRTLNLVLRGTDADFGSDGEAGSGPGQVRYYGQLQPLVDKIFDYVSDPANGITDVVVSGQSLGGTAADLFVLYDGARFDAIEDVSLSVISISSAGIDPVTLDLKTDFDAEIVDLSGDLPAIAAPEYYTQFAHELDFVYFPERYEFEPHAAAEPLFPAEFTAGILEGLTDAVHLGGDVDNPALVEVETPLVPVYELTADFLSTFLPPHYMDLYELNGRNLAEALEVSGSADYDRIVALNGQNFATANVESNNTVNGWMLPVDDSFDLAEEAGDTLILGLGGDDTVALGLGDDFYHGGEGADTVDLSAYGTGVAVDLAAGSVTGGEETGGTDGLLSVENVIGTGFDDTLTGDDGDNVLSPGGGTDSLDGGAGEDTALIDAPASAVTVDGSGDGFTLSYTGGTATLSGIELIELADATYAVDTDEATADAYVLFEVATGEAPDPGALEATLDLLDQGVGLGTVATILAAGSGRLNPALSDEAFVAGLYDDALGRSADDEGVAFWSGLLEDGTLDRGGMVLAFAQSEEAEAFYADSVDEGVLVLA